MKHRHLETLLRHKIVLGLPVIVALLLGTWYGFSHPRQYAAYATLWVEDSAATAAAGTASSAGNAGPAAGQQAVLTELLATRAFLLDIAQHGPDAAALRSTSPAAVDARLSALAKSITVSSPGLNLLSVRVQDTLQHNPVQTLTTVVNRFMAQETTLLRQRAQLLVDYQRSQVTVATDSVTAAQRALDSYLAANPGSGSSDGSRTQLVTSVAESQQHLADAQAAYNQAVGAAQASSSADQVRVFDSPVGPVAQSRRKTLLMGGIGGLLAGLAISLVALLAMAAGDTTIRGRSDVEDTLALRVVGDVAELPARCWPLASGRRG